MKDCIEIEKSIINKYHRNIYAKFIEAIDSYDLIDENDCIGVCISGGKDSFLMAKLFQQLSKQKNYHFDVKYIVMDPGYNQENLEKIQSNLKWMEIPAEIYHTDIFEASSLKDTNPCFYCAKYRRSALFRIAQELGCNKIALGHHYDDVIETILMGMLYGGQVQTMMPKLHSTNFEGMELIRPMYLVREEDIIKWRDYNNLHFIQCACRFTDTCSSCRPDGTEVSKRMEIKHLIANLKKINPYVEGNIFKSVENVNLSTIIAYKENGIKHSFLDTYKETGTNDADF